MHTSNDLTQKNHKCSKFFYDGKLFVIGVLIGCFFSYLWQSLLISNTDIGFTIESIKQDSDVRLLSYIEGRWSSSIGDIIVELDPSEPKDFIVIELIHSNKEESKYKIKSIDKINGLLGIVRMKICNVNDCDENDLIPIQFNKIFGIDKTIAISYDSRITECVDISDECTRAFKRIK